MALLAAIGQIESGSAGGRKIGSDHLVQPGIFGPLLDGGPFAVIRDTVGGRYDGDSEWDRAVGPMQFIPSTWATSGVDGDGDKKADPQNVYDAAHSAAGYLCNHGRDLSKQSDLRAAIWAYNQSTEYVAAVLEWLGYFRGKGLEAIGSVGFKVGSGGRASELKPVAATKTATKTAGKTAKPRTTAASKPSKTTAGSTPDPVTTTPSSTTGSTTGSTTATGTGSGTTTASPTTGTGSTSTTGTAGPEPTATENCPTGEPSTSTTTPSPTTTTAPDPTTTGPTTACDTPSTATPTTTATTTTATTAGATSGTTSTEPASPTSSTP